MAVPASWTTVARRMSTLPVSGSTSTSTITVQKAPPTPAGATVARPTIGAPVAFSLPAISLKDIRFAVDPGPGDGETATAPGPPAGGSGAEPASPLADPSGVQRSSP